MKCFPNCTKILDFTNEQIAVETVATIDQSCEVVNKAVIFTAIFSKRQLKSFSLVRFSATL